VDHEPRVAGVFRGAHLDGKLQLLGEGLGLPERLAGLRIGGLSLPQQLAERVELVTQLV